MNTLGSIVDALFILSVLAALVFLFRKKPPNAASVNLDFLLVKILPLTFVTAGGLVLRQILRAPFWDRNATRLVGTFLIKYGFPLYTPVSDGPLFSMNYPPLSALSFFPAAIFNQPTTAVLSAECLNILYFFSPVILVLNLKNSKSAKNSVPVSVLFLLFFFLTYQSDSLRYAAFRIHADAPGLGLSLLAALSLFRYLKTHKMFFFYVSCFLTVLAVCAKQTFIFLPVALALFLLMAGAWRTFRRFVGWTISLNFLTLLFASRFINISVMSENLFFLRKIGWKSNLVESIVMGSVDFVSGFALPLSLMILGVGMRWGKSKAAAQTLRNAVLEVVQDDFSTLLFWIGLVMLPLALISYAKIGGDANSLALTQYFWGIGALSSLPAMADEIRIPGRCNPSALLAIFISLFVTIHLPPLLYYRFSSMIGQLDQNPQQQSTDYIRAHPGKAYFPWNPLSHLMAERKRYHFDAAIYDMALAKIQMSRAHYERFIPPQMELFAFHKDNDFSFKITPNLLENFEAQRDDKELPDWIVYRKKVSLKP